MKIALIVEGRTEKAFVPILRGFLERHLPSSRGELHPPALTEPDVNLSIHPARAIQPKAVSPTANARTG